MITFKQFILEDGENAQDHTVEEAAKIFQQRCHDWKYPSEPLWRYTGHIDDDGPRGPSSRSSRIRKKRSIANTADIQEYFLSKPAWSGFPDRAKSTFAFTEEIGHDEMHLYAIYPYNGTIMAVTTTGEDFNLIDLGGGITPMNMMSILMKTLDKYASDWHEMISDHSFKKLYEFLVRDTVNVKNPDAELTFFRNLDKKFTPEGMDIKLMSSSTFDHKLMNRQHEVWFVGRYLAIHEKDLHAFVKAVQQ